MNRIRGMMLHQRPMFSQRLLRALCAHGYGWLTLAEVERLGPQLIQLCLLKTRGVA